MVDLTYIHDEEPEVVEMAEIEEEILNEKTASFESTEEESVEKVVEEVLQDIVAAVENDDDFEDDDDDEDSEDEGDDDYEEDVANETVLERIVALKGAIPPSYRYKLSNAGSSLYSTLSTTFKYSGKAIWIITTSSLLLGVPLTLSVISEQQLMEMEKEMQLTQSSNELLAPGAESGFQQAPVAA